VEVLGMIVGVACSDSSDHKAHVDPVDGRKPVAACSNTSRGVVLANTRRII